VTKALVRTEDNFGSKTCSRVRGCVNYDKITRAEAVKPVEGRNATDLNSEGSLSVAGRFTQRSREIPAERNTSGAFER
jgi:hypothetical protein